jgi:choline monooxygenase
LVNTVLTIDPDIRRALMPPADFYRKAEYHRALVERVLARSWQVQAGPELEAGEVQAFEWLAGSVDEPLVWTCAQGGELSCLSNVCTHRGARLCEGRKAARSLLCPYHGRRFDLAGRLKHAPGFEDAMDFPRERDHLRHAATATWGPLRFSALDPNRDFETIAAQLDTYLGFTDPATWVWDDDGVASYPIAANWMLYCDNYLEGFHVPFVHPGLAKRIELSSYEHRLLDGMALQVAFAREGEAAFEPPVGHPDHGRRVAAWYFLLFPNLMLNVYPWGLSLNRVRPVGVDACVVDYARWLSPAAVARPAMLDEGAGSALDQVEAEDQAVVLSAQAGLAARLYPGGRYSPQHERGLHHFHRWLGEQLAPAS